MTRHQELHFIRKRMKLLKRELQINQWQRERGIWNYPPAFRLPI